MVRKGHVPIRMCVGCRERRKKEELLRLIQKPGGADRVADKPPSPGRGFYLCRDRKCFELARKKRLLGTHVDMTCLELQLTQGLKVKD